jgi:hypothetical protein
MSVKTFDTHHLNLECLFKGHLNIQRPLTRRYQSKNLFHKLLFKKCVEVSTPLIEKVSQRMSVQKYKIFQEASVTSVLEGF